MINIVIPMAGLGSRFASAGYEKPKPFIDVLGIPMIQRVMMNLELEDSRFILIARKEHLANEKEIVNKIQEIYNNVIFIGIDKLTEGTACTLLFAKKYIDNNYPLLIANSDQIVDIEIADFVNQCLNKNHDGCLLEEVNYSLIRSWIIELSDAKIAATSINRKMASLKWKKSPSSSK